MELVLARTPKSSTTKPTTPLRKSGDRLRPYATCALALSHGIPICSPASRKHILAPNS
jgi:hypothetical protein